MHLTLIRLSAIGIQPTRCRHCLCSTQIHFHQGMVHGFTISIRVPCLAYPQHRCGLEMLYIIVPDGSSFEVPGRYSVTLKAGRIELTEQFTCVHLKFTAARQTYKARHADTTKMFAAIHPAAETCVRQRATGSGSVKNLVTREGDCL